MTEASMPNPVELFEKTTSNTRKIVSGVKQDQLDDSTPCTEWSVRDVVNHLIGQTELTSAGLSGNPGEIGAGQPPKSSYADETDANKLSDAYEAEVSKLLKAANEPGALEKSVPMPSGEMPIGQLLMGVAMDHLVHGWDIAKATGQDTTLDPDLVQASYGILTNGFADQGRQMGLIGPVVSVADDASLQDKMLAHLGRQP